MGCPHPLRRQIAQKRMVGLLHVMIRIESHDMAPGVRSASWVGQVLTEPSRLGVKSMSSGIKCDSNPIGTTDPGPRGVRKSNSNRAFTSFGVRVSPSQHSPWCRNESPGRLGALPHATRIWAGATASTHATRRDDIERTRTCWSPSRHEVCRCARKTASGGS